MSLPRRAPFRPLSMLALALVVASCAKSPVEDSQQPSERGAEPIAGGQVFGVGLEVAPALDSARVETLGAWAGENVPGERFVVPLEPNDMVFGSPTARVTVVVFNDYQCPYCGRFDRSLRELMDTYPTDVRVVIKHFPLAMHKQASAAAKAVLAAHRQGRGQVMHQLVFDNQRKLDDEGLRKLAAEAQLPDPSRFAADLNDPALDAQVQRDMALGAKLAVRSTPSFFVNGLPHSGAKDLDQLQALYAQEVSSVAGLIEQGAARAEVYDALMAAASPTRAEPKRDKPSSVRPGKPDPDLRYAVPVTGRPSRGPDDALVTIVQFADFECPFCRRVLPTLEQLEQRYGKDVRFVFMQQPLPMHKQALPAAKAALAAHRQNSFWAMHDGLYQLAEQRSLSESAYEDLARDLGLDLKRFRKDMKDPKLLDEIHADQAIGTRFGMGGTPSFFINGRPLSGAQPVEVFVALVDEELSAAKSYAKKHKVKAGKLYEEMSKNWETEVAKPGVADNKRRNIDLKGLPARGNTKQAKIELVVCADFDCPYCKRGADLADQILSDKRYKGEVGFYFLHFPLPMHKNAEIAHRAAIAAGEQGKFWEMHDLLFANKDQRSEAQLVDMAKQLKLDPKRFLQDLNSQTTTKKIAADKDVCSKLGVTGTPNFFVNGRSMRGAVPLSMASEVLDEELGG